MKQNWNDDQKKWSWPISRTHMTMTDTSSSGPLIQKHESAPRGLWPNLRSGPIVPLLLRLIIAEKVYQRNENRAWSQVSFGHEIVNKFADLLLRVVPSSLSQSFSARPQDFARPFFPRAVFFRVTHDELSKKGTTRSLQIIGRVQCNTELYVQLVNRPSRVFQWGNLQTLYAVSCLVLGTALTVALARYCGFSAVWNLCW